MRIDGPSPKVTVIVHDGSGKLTTKLYDTTIHEVADVIRAAISDKLQWTPASGAARGPKAKVTPQLSLDDAPPAP